MKLNTNTKKVWGIVGSAIGLTLLSLGIDGLYSHLTRYDKDGFDANGYNREGFNRDGYNSEGYDYLGYNKDGFNQAGYNSQGYDYAGYDRNGYAADGYNNVGRDKQGFDRNGYDEEGYDRFGRDKDGFHRNGFARDGFDREGYDRQGYGRDRYNCDGIDRAGYCRQFYATHIEQLRERLEQATHQMNFGEYRYALYDARIVFEETLRLLVQHVGGQAYLGDKLLENLKICEKKQLLDTEFINRLHGVRKICNINGHELSIDEHNTHAKVFFVVMQISDLLDKAEALLVYV